MSLFQFNSKPFCNINFIPTYKYIYTYNYVFILSLVSFLTYLILLTLVSNLNIILTWLPEHIIATLYRV